MSLETDLLIDRRRLKRRLFFWRVVAILAVVACAAIAIRPAVPRSHVARLKVDGEISDTTRMVRALDAMAKDDSAKALVLDISSPGGGVYAAEALHNAIARVAEKKPVVAVMGALAASGGFMIAMPAKRIYASTGTITGSIGVLLQTQEISGLLDRVGVTAETLTSGPLKDQPSLTHKLSDDGRAVLHGLVIDMYEQFVAIVADGRHMAPERVRELADGRVYTGRQALKLGLIDAIGDEHDARQWLQSNSGISADLPIRDLRTKGRLQSVLADAVAPFLSDTLKSVVYQGVALDGAKALWQPSSPE